MDYASLNRVNHAFSDFVVYGLFGVGLVLWVLVMVALAIRATMQARASTREVTDPNALRPGDVLLPGVVELAPGESGPPVSLTIHQHGEERRTKNGYYVAWKETSRTALSRPFYLRLVSGMRVRVEPGQDVHLIDAMEEPSRQPGSPMRARTAMLAPGEAVWLGGSLGQGMDPHLLAYAPQPSAGYREATGQHLVLRPGRGGRFFASSEPVEARFKKRATFFAVWAVVGVLVGAVYHYAQSDYHQLRLYGVDVQARVTNTERRLVRVKNGYNTYYDVYFETSYAPTVAVRDQTSREVFESLQGLGEHTVPVVVDPQDPMLAQIGGSQHLGISVPANVFSWLTAMFLFGIQIGWWTARRPWHERKTFNEQTSGRLFDY